jgi:hypothetical protein
LWQYEVQWYDGGDRALENVIVVESQARNLGSFGLIDLKMWTSSDETSDLVTNQHPMKVYVQVARGSSPVLEAKVKVLVTVSLRNGTVLKLDPIELFDRGNGDPDLMAGDGVYSRYVTKYPADGRYSFSAFVDDNEAKAFTIQAGRNGRAMPARPPNPGLNPVCCGSEVNVPTDLRRPTGSFKRTLNGGPVVHLLEVPLPEAGDLMPPARIGDLRLEADDTGRKLVAQWTAPGDDFDSGNVSSYKFIFSEDITDLLDASRQPPVLHTVTRQDEAGAKATYSFTFKRYDQDYHVAMYGLDESGNAANISNIVLVRLPQPPGTEGPTDPSEPDPLSPRETDWIMVGVVSGVVLTLLILLLVGLYIYFFMFRRRNHNKSKSSGVNVDLPANTGAGSDNSSFDEAKNSSSNQLVPQISTISNAYKAAVASNHHNDHSDTNGSASFANGITPTYWSASQLLKEHEERKLRETQVKMGPIAEEETNAGYDYSSEPFHQYGYYQNEYHPQHPYPQNQEVYNPAMMYSYVDGHRLSTADSGFNMGFQTGAVDYNPNAEQYQNTSDTESALMRNNNKVNTSVPKNSGNSDNSSSGTLGIANNSLQGSLISVNSGRPPSSVSKTRNITQV